RLHRSQVIDKLRGVAPLAARTHVASVEGERYPVKQVVAAATGLDPLDFNTNQARNWLRQLGFAVERLPPSRSRLE
ncbi:MAG: hypothetical protein AB7F89_23235, partial [Pirellulaceae bacterium]